MKCIGGQIKAFSFLFCTVGNAKSTKVQKVQKVASINIQKDCKTMSKKRTD